MNPISNAVLVSIYMEPQLSAALAKLPTSRFSKASGRKLTALRSLVCGLGALLLFVCVPTTGYSAEAAPPAPLPKGTWTEPAEGFAVDAFTLGAGETHSGGWGGYSPNERRYFDEFLPALFERTLVVNAPANKRGFQWIFTGERAMLTIKHDGPGKALEVQMTFHDSPALDLMSNYKPARNPQGEVRQASFTLPDSASPRALTVRLDQKLSLVVLADGAPILQSTWMHAFSRHQLQLSKGSGPLAFRILTPQPRKVAVTVDSAKTHQTMLGWGGIGTPTAYRELSEEGRRQWWRWVADYNLLFQREYPVGSQLNPGLDNWDRLGDAKAHYYGENFPNGEVSDYPYNKAIQTLGGFVIFEFWDFPRWVGNNPEAYTKAMINYCEVAKTKTGSAPFAVGIQNELGMKPELVEPFVTTLRKGLDEKGFKDVKIHMANAPMFVMGLTRLPPYRDNPAVWDKIDFAACNNYDFQERFADIDKLDGRLRQWRERTGDKPFLATEWCINERKYQNDGYLLALSSGQSYHKLLTITNASLISYCWTILNVEQPSYAMTRSLFAIDRTNGFVPKPSSAQLRVYGAYSRRVQRDMVRSEAVSSDPDVMASAFKDKNGRTTLVLLNRGTSPAEVKWTWPEAKPTTAELTDPYHQNQILTEAPAPSKPIIIPGGGIVTLSDVPLVSLPANFQAP
jgi:hypothetical protein